MNNGDALQLACEWTARNKGKVTARLGGEVVYIDTLDLANAVARKRYVNALVDKLPAADGAAVERELLALADRPATVVPASTPEEADGLRVVRGRRSAGANATARPCVRRRGQTRGGPGGG